MLVVAAVEFGHPVKFIVLMEAGDVAFHNGVLVVGKTKTRRSGFLFRIYEKSLGDFLAAARPGKASQG
jgi:hypothetical protein